jgi:NAD(P)-dependent dehydrogenase (short-subunit alcohol dehydrogenase family)
LRREVSPLGVKVIVVEPGGVRTEMPGRAIATANELASGMTPELTQRYGGLVRAITAQTAAFTGPGSGLSADAAAKVVARAVTARNPRPRYTAGRDAAMLTLLARMLPDRILDFVFAAGLRPYFPKAGT